MTCSTCSSWRIRPSHESERGDKAMEAMGWRNCLTDKTPDGWVRFYSGMAPACVRWKQ